MNTRMNGSRMPLTTWVKTMMRMSGSLGMSTIPAPSTIMPV